MLTIGTCLAQQATYQVPVTSLVHLSQPKRLMPQKVAKFELSTLSNPVPDRLRIIFISLKCSSKISSPAPTSRFENIENGFSCVRSFDNCASLLPLHCGRIASLVYKKTDKYILFEETFSSLAFILQSCGFFPHSLCMILWLNLARLSSGVH